MDAFENGRFQNKPFIVGSTTEEAVMFISCVFAKLPTVEYEAMVYGLFPADAAKVLLAYPPSGTGDEQSVAAELVTHYLFSCPVRKTLRTAARRGDSDVWLYVFAHALAQGWPKEVSCCNGHVCHASDLFFEFQSLKLTKYNYTHDEQVLADSMAYYYGNFAHTGDPNKPGSHMAQGKPAIPWPPYLQSEGFRNVRFDVPEDSIDQQYLQERCDFWDSINPYP
ncbi:cAMP-regulated D2 protein-like [Branchiostoma floridae]|uniref:cAMP-regulated D2 protein-like n=1 Tax=Branchiostoma floridae TaxID=7739 RepID=A0A9J7LJB9_BRAFL|nr:cAMP-regulated D2 protein-like [Branchiostoma floridae]